MKKLIGFYILFLIAIYILVGCGTNKNKSEDDSEVMKENKMDESKMESSDMTEENGGDQMEMMDSTQVEQKTTK